MTFSSQPQTAPLTAWEPYVAPPARARLTLVLPVASDPFQPRKQSPFRLRAYTSGSYESHPRRRLMGGYA